jgi:hypothetical protein
MWSYPESRIPNPNSRILRNEELQLKNVFNFKLSLSKYIKIVMKEGAKNREKFAAEERLLEANRLIGPTDAQRWWRKNKDIFTHPRFVERWVPDYTNYENFAKIYFGHTDAVWAQPARGQGKFGVYIVRRGRKILYEGRDERQVAHWLGISAKL